MKPLRAFLFLLLLLVLVFSLGLLLQKKIPHWANYSKSGGSVMKMVLGDSRRMFANHFFIKADASYHSGRYPSVFDQAREAEEKEAAVAHGGEHEEHEHSETNDNPREAVFLGKPTDWIDRFGRHFRITEHTHLEGANVREILPWLRISAELDPQNVRTYTTAAYWLRRHMNKVDEAEQFLREGLRANPDSYEILFELGHLYYDDRHDALRARNLWTLAVRHWHELQDRQDKPDFGTLHDLANDLAHLEEDQGNLPRAVEWLEVAKPHSPHPEVVQARIDVLRAKIDAGTKH